MNSGLIRALKQEQQYLQASLGAVEQVLQLMESGGEVTREEWDILFSARHRFRDDFQYPWFGTGVAKIEHALKYLGKFCRKEEIILQIIKWDPFCDRNQFPTLLSRMVKEARLVSMKYNSSNLFVYYGLPHFVNWEEKPVLVKETYLPDPAELKSIRVKKITLNCGGKL